MGKISGHFLLITPPLGVEVVSGDKIEEYILNDPRAGHGSKTNQLETMEKFSGFSSAGDFLEVTLDNGKGFVVKLGKKFKTSDVSTSRVEVTRPSDNAAVDDQPEGKKP